MDLLLKNLRNALQRRADLMSRGYWTQPEWQEVNETIRQLEKKIDAIQQ
jgi:multidrug resistance efflux pump